MDIVNPVFVVFGEEMRREVGIINNVIEFVETRKDDREGSKLLCQGIESVIFTDWRMRVGWSRMGITDWSMRVSWSRMNITCWSMRASWSRMNIADWSMRVSWSRMNMTDWSMRVSWSGKDFQR